MLPTSPAAAKIARQFLELTECRDHPADRQDAMLLVSELVTNALLHGAPPISVTVQCAGTQTVVNVTDSGPWLTALTTEPPPSDAPTGRGLHLLQALAQDWGIRPHHSGKTVWFSL